MKSTTALSASTEQKFGKRNATLARHLSAWRWHVDMTWPLACLTPHGGLSARSAELSVRSPATIIHTGEIEALFFTICMMDSRGDLSLFDGQGSRARCRYAVLTRVLPRNHLLLIVWRALQCGIFSALVLLWVFKFIAYGSEASGQ